jgi:oxalate decarboxylase/phosphoglucose isomerase-like protein (cupin superfamily)
VPQPAEAGGRGTACLQGMVDLTPLSGLPLWLDPQGPRLFLEQPQQELSCHVRTAAMLADVLLEPDSPTPDYLYCLFSDVVLPTDAGVWQEHDLRHDLLLVRAGLVGREYCKTGGHALVRADGAWCPQVFGVLHGRGGFLLQEPIDNECLGMPPVQSVRWVVAGPGHKVLVPAQYGITIANLGEEPLVLSSIAAIDSWPEHRFYRCQRGAAYYVVDERQQPDFVGNPRYAQPLPPVRFEAPTTAPNLGISDDVPLYSAFVHAPEGLAWLKQGVPARMGVC